MPTAHTHSHCADAGPQRLGVSWRTARYPTQETKGFHAGGRSASRLHRRTCHTRASGFSLVEFLLISVPILLLTLGGMELTHWFHVRHMVGLALVEAARAGATQHAQPAAIAQAFERALRPLFAGATPQATDVRLTLALRTRSRAMGDGPPWQIRIVRPDARDFAQFAAPALAIARRSGLPAIRNDYQFEQQQLHTQAHGDGMPANADASANSDAHIHADARAFRNATVFQANTLVLRLSYPHSPLLPGVARLLAGLHIHTDAYARRALAAGLLPMVREVHLNMASHPVDWPSLPDGRVIKGLTDDTAPGGPPPSGPIPGSASCVGLWCRSQALRPLPRTPESGLPDASGGHGGSDPDAWGADLWDADADGSAEDATLIDVEC